MGPGDTVGHWRLLTEAPGDAGVARWRAEEVATGEPVEVLAARRHLEREDAARFRVAHDGLRVLEEAAFVPTLERLEGPQGPIAVRSPLLDPTLADVAGPLDPAVVAWIGARVLPAVRAASQVTGGVVTGADLGLNHQGHPVYAPRCRPLSRVASAATGCAAPETLSGGAVSPAAGLYGLGVVLYRLATGKAPSVRGSAERPVPPPPPSALVPGFPSELDEAIGLLLSPEPADRAGAMPLLQQCMGPPEDLSTALTAPAIPAALVALPDRSRATEDRPPHLVLVTGPTLAGLSPSKLSAVAGYAELPISRVDALARSAAPVAVGRFETRRAARARIEELERAGVSALVADGRSTLLAVALWGTVLAALATGAVGLLISLLGLFFVGVPLAALAALMAVAAGAGLYLTRGVTQPAEERREPLPESLAACLALSARNRREIAMAELPEPAEMDLRDALKAIEARLTSLVSIQSTATRALAQVDPDMLRTKIAKLELRAVRDPSVLPERDRMARALADMEEVGAQRDAAQAEVVAIRSSLDEVTSVLADLTGRLQVDLAGERDEAMTELGRATRAVAALAAETQQ